MSALASAVCAVADQPVGAAQGVPPLSAPQKRAAQPDLVQWSLAALAPQLPLPFPVPPDLPLPPKTRYRSAYHPPDPTHRPDPATLARCTDFEIALHLIDFGPPGAATRSALSP